MMRVDGVDRDALLAQTVGEQHFPGVHVDAGEQRRDFRVRVADVDPRVGERIGELLGVGERLEVLWKSFAAPLGALEELVDALSAPRVSLDAHAHRGLVDLS